MLKRILWLCLIGAGFAPCPGLYAQDFSLYPFRISSESGFLQFKLSGRAILEGFFLEQDGAGLIEGNESFFSGRGSLFADFHLGRRIYISAEMRVDNGEAPRKGVLTGRLEQAFIRFTPSLKHNLQLQYGRFVSPFGAYNQRHDTAADPFIRPPLMYDYRTMASSNFTPRSSDGFIDWKLAPEIWRPRGAPVIWGNPYQTGFMISGGFRKFDYRLAIMNSAPSSEPGMWYPQIGQEIHPSWVAHVGYRIVPELYVGMAMNSGPYLGERLKSRMTDEEFNSYKQKIWGMEFLFEKDKTQIRGEFFHDTWEVDNVPDRPTDHSGYVEIKQKLYMGFFGAIRYGTIAYNKIRRASGALEPWDYDARRWQTALGYRLLRNLALKGEYMWNHTDGPQQPRDNLFSLQCRFEF